MSQKIILKKSSVTSKIPSANDLEYGEVALNFTDGRMYFKNNSNEIEYFEKNEGPASEFKVFETDLDCGLVSDLTLSLELDLGLVTTSVTESYELGVLTISGLIHPTQLVLPSYAASSLPTNKQAGQLVFLSDDIGGACIAFSDGTDWRRVSDNTIIT
jgi:hypothetical protein